MMRVETYINHNNGSRRHMYAAVCDVCGSSGHPKSSFFADDLSQEVRAAALGGGWRERIKGNVLWLLCPSCATENPSEKEGK